MRSSPRSLLTAALILSIPMLFAGKGKCRKDPAPTDPIVDSSVKEEVPDPEVIVQVVSVSPSQLKSEVHTPLKVYGAGFAGGVVVQVGPNRVSSVALIDENTLSLVAPGMAPGSYDLVVTNPDGTSSTLHSAVRVMEEEVDSTCRRMAMYFELDASILSKPAKNVLDGAMDCLRQQAVVHLEGHADERGTTDYNVALGQRRAEAVQSYLVNQGGIPARKLPVISYGEERPADPASNEVAWAKNRRVELVAQ